MVFDLASSAAPALILIGCATRSAQVSSTGIAASISSNPSSLSRSALMPRPSISSLRTPVTCATPSSSAISGPTCPVSASSEYFPSKMRSNFPRLSDAANARAVASVSEPANARSVIWTARSIPIASACSSASRACGGPSVITVVSAPWRLFSSIASEIARRSNALMTLGPSRLIVFVSGSKLASSISGICLIRTASFNTNEFAPAAKVTVAIELCKLSADRLAAPWLNVRRRIG